MRRSCNRRTVLSHHTEGEDAEGYDTHYRQKSDDQSPLFAEHAEHQIGFRCGYGVEPSVSGAHADQSSACGSGHGAHLLISHVAGLFPGMSPYGEAFGDVRFKAQYQEQSTYGASGDQRQRCEIPERRKAMTRKVAKKIAAVPKSLMIARDNRQNPDRHIKPIRFRFSKSRSKAAAPRR